MPACHGCYKQFKFENLNSNGYCKSCASKRQKMKQKLDSEPPKPVKKRQAPLPTQRTDRHQKNKSPDTGMIQKFGLLAVAAAGFAIAFAIWDKSATDGAGAEYAAALADCATNPRKGAAAIEALDAIYGEDARPNNLDYKLAMCVAEGAIEDLNRINNLLESLN